MLVHLILLRKQRLMKHCVLLRIAWSQNGHVMCANPIHLDYLRMQRLMKNSAMPPPLVQRLQTEEGYKLNSSISPLVQRPQTEEGYLFVIKND